MHAFATLAAFVAAASAVAAAPQFASRSDTYAVLMDKRTGLPVPRSANEKRDDPSTHDLLASCPQPTPSRKRVQGADTCVWTQDSTAGDIYETKKYLYSGDALQDFTSNCDASATTNRDITITGTSTFTQSFSVDTSVGLDLGPFSFGLSQSIGHYTTTANADHSKISIAPGQKGAIVSFQNIQPATGTVQINYGDKVADHYIWYVNNVHADLLTGDPTTGPVLIGCDEANPSDISK